MHFSVFAKMRKSCENGQFSRNFVFAKNFRTGIAKISTKISYNFRKKGKLRFSRKFLQKSCLFFAKIFAKMKNADFRENRVNKTKNGDFRENRVNKTKNADFRENEKLL
jgi:hypothetical protein